MTLRRLHTADLSLDELAGARALLDLSFRDFTDEDWQHGLGGLHVLVEDDGALVGHGSLVMRRVLVEGRSLRAGYVEGVAVHPEHRRRGHADAVMERLEALAPAYDLLALSASRAGVPLYASRGWTQWRGPTYVLAEDGRRRTEDDDGGVWVRGELDVDRPIACDWRDGDVW